MERCDQSDKEASDQVWPLGHHEKQCGCHPGGTRSCSLKGLKQRGDVVRSPSVPNSLEMKMTENPQTPSEGVRTIWMADEGSPDCPWERSREEREHGQLWKAFRRSQGLTVSD